MHLIDGKLPLRAAPLHRKTAFYAASLHAAGNKGLQRTRPFKGHKKGKKVKESARCTLSTKNCHCVLHRCIGKLPFYYRSLENEKFLADQGFRSQLHHKKPKGKPMPAHTRQGNKARDGIRAKVERVFSVQKEQMGIFIRTIGLQRPTVKLSLANMAYNIKRLVFWENRRVLAG